jgi:hypothetical protein
LGLWDGWVNQLKVIFSDKTKSSSEATMRNPHTSLEELYNLYQKGILTEDEYKVKKEEYLKRL